MSDTGTQHSLHLQDPRSGFPIAGTPPTYEMFLLQAICVNN